MRFFAGKTSTRDSPHKSGNKRQLVLYRPAPYQRAELLRPRCLSCETQARALRVRCIAFRTDDPRRCSSIYSGDETPLCVGRVCSRMYRAHLTGPAGEAALTRRLTRAQPKFLSGAICFILGVRLSWGGGGAVFDSCALRPASERIILSGHHAMASARQRVVSFLKWPFPHLPV